MADQTQTAYSTSMFSDLTNIAAMIQIGVGVLALPEVVAIIPLSWMPVILAVSGAASFGLRTWKAVRPVSLIAVGEVKPVEVPKLQKTQQGTETPKG
jgi:hypothetical protein